MTTFPRAAGALPRLATPPVFPSALQSWGPSGKGQTRAVTNMGRTWTEVYPILDCANPNVRALLAAINLARRGGVLWSVQHPYWHVRNGAGGGSPVIAGAGQTGSALNISGATGSVTNWLRAGDMISIAGGPVVYDITADVNSASGGTATLAINPPIFTALASGAVITIDPTAIVFKAYIVDVPQLPNMDVTRYIDAGMQLSWREAPQ